jgi:spermidine synthase
VLWARDWALLYGSTAVGTAVVLAVYFGGLAGGAALGGRLARDTRGLVLYAALEGALALAVVVYLAVRPLLPAAAAWIGHATPTPIRPAVQVLWAALVLGLPTVLIGATLPAAAATLPPGATAAAARLYVWNTLGGVAGALLTGFLAVRAVGVRGAFLAAVAVDAGVAAAAFALRRRVVADVPVVRRDARPRDTERPRLALLVAATTGGVGLAAEVLWTRGLAGVLSQSIYSVALVLSAVLLGLVGGGRIGVRLLRRPAGIVPQLANVLLLLAVTIATSVVAASGVAAVSLRLVRTFAVAGPAAGLAVEAILALLVVLVPATALGTAFPLVLALAGGDAPAGTLGRVLAANTAGGIAGALGGAFVLLPWVGLGGGLLLGAAAVAGVAAALAGWTPRGALAALVALGALAAAVAAPALRVAWLGGEGERLVFYRDGPTATVMVTADAEGRKRLRVNGKYSLGGTSGLFLEQREAHVPLLLHPAPERLLALGVGTADTVGAAAAHPDLRVDGVELVPEALAAAALFARENAGALTNPSVHLVADDARSHLLATRESWDVILSDLFLPWTAGTASLYSLDFYRQGLARLRPGGLYCQWLPLHQLAVGDLETIVATFVAAFPEVQLWVGYHRTLTPLAALIGSATPLRPDARTLTARLESPRLRATVHASGLDTPADLAALYVTDGAHLRTVTRDVPLNTDDRPRLEFSTPAAYFHQEGLAAAALAWVAARLDPGPAPPGGRDLAPFALRAELLRAQLALLDGDRPAELRAYLAALAVAPDLRTVRAAVAAIAEERLAAGDRTTAARIATELRTRAPDAPEAAALARMLGGTDFP